MTLHSHLYSLVVSTLPSMNPGIPGLHSHLYSLVVSTQPQRRGTSNMLHSHLYSLVVSTNRLMAKFDQAWLHSHLYSLVVSTFYNPFPFLFLLHSHLYSLVVSTERRNSRRNRFLRYDLRCVGPAQASNFFAFSRCEPPSSSIFSTIISLPYFSPLCCKY